MYLRATTRKKDGKTHRYWRLVESVRIGRRVIQRTVAQLGELDAAGRLRARALARHLIGSPEQGRLFEDGHADVTVPVRLKRIRVERPRQFGDVYLALALWRGTGLEELCEGLLPAAKEQVPWAKMISVLVAARQEGLYLAQERRRFIDEGHVSTWRQRDHFGASNCGVAFRSRGGAQEIVITDDDQSRLFDIPQLWNEIEAREISVDVKIAATSPHCDEHIPTHAFVARVPGGRPRDEVIRGLGFIGEFAIFR